VSLTRDEVIRYLDGLSGTELALLIDDVLRRFGLPAFAKPAQENVLSGVAPINPYDYSVALLEHGSDKIRVIKAVREIEGLGLGLAEAKALVESAPVVLRRGLRRDEAEDLARKLEQAGAGVEVRASSYGSSYW
jgi:large subunit ribosomal protein L7/L12